MRRPAVATLLAATLLCAGCGQWYGRQATKGALRATERSAQEIDPEERGPAFERAARGATAGALTEISKPEHLEELQKVVRAMTAGAIGGVAEGVEGVGGATDASGRVATPERDAVAPEQPARPSSRAPAARPMERMAGNMAHGAASAFMRELGPEGEGRLGRSLEATSRRMSAAAVRGAQDEVDPLFPECEGPGRSECVERRIAGLAKSASAGASQGIRETLAWPALLLAFAAGLLAALLAVALWSGLRRRRGDRRVERRPPGHTPAESGA